MKRYPGLFTETSIGTCRMKNRFAMAPMGPMGLGDADGGFNQRGIDFYTERAKGGVGLLITGVTYVENEVEEHQLPNCPAANVNPVHFIRTGKELTERVHAYDAKIFLQMAGGFGRVAIPKNIGEVPPLSASAVPHYWLDNTVCRAMTKEEIRYIVQQFGKGAYNAKRAGFDGVQVHAVHEGYLLDQFAIAFFNHRTDEYGGPLENRLRFAKEVVEEIKKTCGEDFPVTLRYSPKSFIKDFREGALPGEEFEEKGRDLEEGVEAAKLLEQYGYDALDVDVGSYDAWWWSHPPMYQEKGLYIPYAKLVKEHVTVPVLCAGRMDNPELAAKALADGACDIISLGRPLLADPDYVSKLRAGKVKMIRPCLSCQEGCMGRIQEYSALNCAVNPQACRERAARLIPALKPKKVLVIGGGVAGCEAARVLRLRGHEPVLFEKASCLGGNLIPGGVPTFKEDDHALAAWYAAVLAELEVPVHLNMEISIEEARAMECDALIIATGSVPKTIPLGDNAKVFTAAEVLQGEKNPGHKTAVVGGGLVGCELALWLRERGVEVVLLEALPQLLGVNRPVCTANSGMLERLVPFKKVDVKTNTKAKAYRDGVLELSNGETVACDSVILAVGYRENNGIYEQLKADAKELYLLGDARQVSNIMYAIWDAFEVASQI